MSITLGTDLECKYIPINGPALSFEIPQTVVVRVAIFKVPCCSGQYKGVLSKYLITVMGYARVLHSHFDQLSRSLGPRAVEEDVKRAKPDIEPVGCFLRPVFCARSQFRSRVHWYCERRSATGPFASPSWKRIKTISFLPKLAHLGLEPGHHCCLEK